MLTFVPSSYILIIDQISLEVAMFISRAPILLAERAQRERRKITQQEVADATSLTRATISSWMSHSSMARLDATAAKAFCDYFGVGIDELVTFEDAPIEQATGAR
jgi:transcriptional regulator with XRE-family HTH domain